jgi:hypothetical protein
MGILSKEDAGIILKESLEETKGIGSQKKW